MNKRYRDVGRCRPGSAALKTHQMSSSLAAQTALGAATNRNRGGKDTLAAYISVLSELLAVSRCHARSGARDMVLVVRAAHTPPMSSAGSRSIRTLRDNDHPLPTRAHTQWGRWSKWFVCVCLCVCQGDIGAGYEDFTQGCIKCLP